MPVTELRNPIRVRVVSPELPVGVDGGSRKGICIAWDMKPDSCLWQVIFNTGEPVWVPQEEIRVRANWSYGRRYV